MRALSPLLSAALLLGTLAMPAAARADDSFYDVPAPGERIDLGGYKLHLKCQGEGSPAVVLDAGLGDWSTHWTAVQNLLRADTRVCSYDRAGYGWSDPGPRPRDSARIVTELHLLLQKAGIAPPYILAGHSFGGLNMRLYAGTYPAEVAGLVLVDASHPDSLPYQLEGAGTAPTGSIANRLMVLHRVEPDDAKFPPEAQPAIHDPLLRTKSLVASRNEYRYLAASVRALSKARAIGDIPLAVISRGLRQWPPGAEGDAREAEWQRQQAELVRLSRLGHHDAAARSGHDIHLDQPELVAAAIRAMVKEERDEVAAMPWFLPWHP